MGLFQDQVFQEDSTTDQVTFPLPKIEAPANVSADGVLHDPMQPKKPIRDCEPEDRTFFFCTGATALHALFMSAKNQESICDCLDKLLEVEGDARRGWEGMEVFFLRGE